MTTVDRPGVHAIAIEGTFDDCQDIVKALFNDLAFRDELALSGVNSINWARILAQIVYYFTSAVALGAPGRKVVVRRADRQFRRHACRLLRQADGAAHRAPDHRHQRERHSRARARRPASTGCTGVKPTQSPSMDIQVSSNFERLLFEACGRDADAVRAAMASLKQSGEFTIVGGGARRPFARISTLSACRNPNARRRWRACIARAGSRSIRIPRLASPPRAPR